MPRKQIEKFKELNQGDETYFMNLATRKANIKTN